MCRRSPRPRLDFGTGADTRLSRGVSCSLRHFSAYAAFEHRGSAALKGRVRRFLLQGGFSPRGHSYCERDIVIPTLSLPKGRNLLSTDSASTLPRSYSRARHNPRPRQQRFQPTPKRPPFLNLLFLRMLRQISRSRSGHSLFFSISSPFKGHVIYLEANVMSICKRQLKFVILSEVAARKAVRQRSRRIPTNGTTANRESFLHCQPHISMPINLLYRHISIYYALLFISAPAAISSTSASPLCSSVPPVVSSAEAGSPEPEALSISSFANRM